MAAISAVSSARDTPSELVNYQQRLAADRAARAAAKAVPEEPRPDRKAREAEQTQLSQAQPSWQRSTAPIGTPTTETAGAVGSTLDVTV